MLIGLVTCSKAKTAYPAPARELYSKSAQFRGGLAAVAGRADAVYVLSDLHGLVELDQVLAPYERDLKQTKATERRAWAAGVLKSLHDRHGADLSGIAFEFHTGMQYRRGLEPLLTAAGARCTCPVDGLSQGKRLQYYKQNGFLG